MLLDNLRKRYACKGYDPTRRLTEEQVQRIIEAIQLAPTSSGLQPFAVLRIRTEEACAIVANAAMRANADYVRDASDVLVLAGWDRYTEERIDAVYDYTTEVRGLPKGRFASYTDFLKSAYLPQTSEENFVHIARQSYIALGLALAEAAEQGIASTPIEGFDAHKLDDALGLRERGLRSLVIITLGYSDPEKDWLAQQAKVRRPIEELVIEL